MARAGVPETRLRTFVEVFVATSNASEAARAAGYKGSSKVVSESARKLLKRPDVQAMIKAATEANTSARIATRQERQEWWSKVMRGEKVPQVVEGKRKELPAPLALQVKASELLAKSEGDFIKRVEVNHGGQVLLVKAEIPDNGRSRVTPADAEKALASTSPPSSDG